MTIETFNKARALHEEIDGIKEMINNLNYYIWQLEITYDKSIRLGLIKPLNDYISELERGFSEL